jgi:hypothetical protein
MFGFVRFKAVAVQQCSYTLCRTLLCRPDHRLNGDRAQICAFALRWLKRLSVDLSILGIYYEASWLLVALIQPCRAPRNGSMNVACQTRCSAVLSASSPTW